MSCLFLASDVSSISEVPLLPALTNLLVPNIHETQFLVTSHPKLSNSKHFHELFSSSKELSKIKVKVKIGLEEATKTQRGSRGIDLKWKKLAKFNAVMTSHCILIGHGNLIQWTYPNQN